VSNGACLPVVRLMREGAGDDKHSTTCARVGLALSRDCPLGRTALRDAGAAAALHAAVRAGAHTLPLLMLAASLAAQDNRERDALLRGEGPRGGRGTGTGLLRWLGWCAAAGVKTAWLRGEAEAAGRMDLWTAEALAAHAGAGHLQLSTEALSAPVSTLGSR
jgi:hypothetical protein